MQGAKHPLAFLLLALVFLHCFAGCIELSKLSSGRYKEQRRSNGEVTWCIAKPSTEDERLNLNIDYSCRQSGVDCKPIQPGGSCFSPNSAISHASFAMNLFYKSAGKNYWNCHFNGTGLIVTQNPSVGTCNYPA
ncbi:Glucan endo-1,3-beta-glucosidase [Melia azedarach]|uniref:Glucan endo-1,3-beta-glucosidase n=1 Tax=Melia azedarach TaxID=155640 RepID=A0ACC1YW42_MELAZ|nr:Glucan endo-1,3-beta-glucosidase [Melia azedarach]